MSQEDIKSKDHYYMNGGGKMTKVLPVNNACDVSSGEQVMVVSPATASPFSGIRGSLVRSQARPKRAINILP